MNKVIIHNIISQNQKQLNDKNYNIYSWQCGGLVNNQPVQQFTINSFTKKRPDLEYNKEYEMESQVDKFTGAKYLKYKPEYNNQQNYKNSGSKQVTYTLEEYDNLFDHAVLKATGQATKASNVQEDFANIFSSILGTYFIGATKAGVKVLDKIEKVEQAFQGQQVPQQQSMLPPDTSPITDDQVPF